MKKKLMMLGLFILICFSLCACGGQTPEKALQGTWVNAGELDGVEVKLQYIFEKGDFKFQMIFNDEVSQENPGTYTIEDDKIILKYDNMDDPVELSYTMENGEMKIETLEKFFHEK